MHKFNVQINGKYALKKKSNYEKSISVYASNYLLMNFPPFRSHSPPPQTEYKLNSHLDMNEL